MTSPAPEEEPDLAVRLGRMVEPDRSYLIRNLALHLDEAGDADRLLKLGRGAFPRLKTEWTRDASESSGDFRYYFRAALRARDLTAALRLARSRAGLSHLSDWLASGVLAGLLPHLGSSSKLWAQIRRSLAAIEDETERVERLTSFQEPGLDEEIQHALRSEFDRAATSARDTARTGFLTALVAGEPGVIEYVLARAPAVPMNEAFARALVVNVHRLCEGSTTTPARALEQLASLLPAHTDAFVAAADTLATMTDTTTATAGLASLEAQLPTSDAAATSLLCTAAVSHGWAQQGEADRAEALAQRCLDLVPAVPTDITLRLLYTQAFLQAAGRLLLAAAPFASLWPDAVGRATELAARGTTRSHRAEALSRFVEVVPSISDPDIRIAWLDQILQEIAEFVDGDLDSESTDTLDVALPFLAATNGGASPRQQLSQPIEDALLDRVLPDIDRVLVSPTELQPFNDIVTAAADVRLRVEDHPDEPLEFFGRLLAAASRSRNPHVRVAVIEAFLSETSEEPTFEAGVILARHLAGLVGGLEEDTVAALSSVFLDRAESAWCTGRPDRCSTLAQAGLIAAVESRNATLFAAVSSRMQGWIDRAPADGRSYLVIQWAAALAVFGDAQASTRLLKDVPAPARSDRLEVADALIESGARDRAAALLADDLPGAIDFTDDTNAAEAIETARLLVLANGHQDAIALLLAAADECRRSGDIDDDAGTLVLKGVSGLRNDALIAGLLQRAEHELLESAADDASLAARWYAVLALGAAGRLDAATRLRRRLAAWRVERQATAVRDCVNALLIDPGSRRACDALLGAAASVEQRAAAQQALMLVCQTVAHADHGLRSTLVDGVVRIACEDDYRADAPAVLTALSTALTQSHDADLAAHGLGAILAALQTLPEPERDGDGSALTGAILKLMAGHHLAAGDREAALLSHVCHRESGAIDGDRFREALASGVTPRAALDATRQIDDPRRRLMFVGAVVERACGLQDRKVCDDSIAALIEVFDTLGPHQPVDVVRLAAAYAACHGAGLQDVELETRLRAAGAPALAVAVVEWASHLTNTPLQPLVGPAIGRLRQDLNQFAAHNANLRSLTDFLRLAPTSPADAAALIEHVAAWATTMPLVSNEDWRHDAFIQLLQATGRLEEADRAAVQKRVLAHAAAAVTRSHWGWTHLTEALITAPFDTVTSRWALAFWLPEHDGWPTQAIVDLFLKSLRYKSGQATPAMLDAFLDRIAGFVPARLDREAAAAAWREATAPRLREYLRTCLLHDYDAHGLGGLTEAELTFLATLPLAWWEPRSTTAALASASLPVLRAWTERASRHSAESAWWSVVLATEWLSRDNARELPEFLLDLCLLPSWFPEEVRRVVLKSMTA